MVGRENANVCSYIAKKFSDEKRSKKVFFLEMCTQILVKGSNSFFASCDFCCLMITFASSLDPYQDRRSVGPDLASNCLTL